MNSAFLDRFRISDVIEGIPFLNLLISKSFYILFRCIRAFTVKSGKGGVVIISLHKIGDTVFTFPAIKAIYNHYPDKIITILCFERGKEIYDFFFKKCSTSVITPDMFSLKGRVAGRRARKILRKLDPEIIINLSVSLRVITLIINSHAKVMIGADRELYRGLYTSFSLISSAPPLRAIYTDTIKHLIPGIEKFINSYTEASIDPAAKILIHPFAGWEAKEWGLNKFIQLSSRLKADYDVEFVIEEGSFSRETLKELKELNIKVNITRNLTDLLNIINDCSVMVSNDTGCIYLAANSGKATYTIYGPTAPSYSFPKGSQHRFIQKQIICTPKEGQYCFTYGGRVNCPSFECMHLLSTDEVYNDLISFLSDIRISKKIYTPGQLT